MRLMPDKSVASAMEAFRKLREYCSEHFSDVFKKTTTDNGSEFAILSDIENKAAALLLVRSSVYCM